MQNITALLTNVLLKAPIGAASFLKLPDLGSPGTMYDQPALQPATRS